jgi:GT2 family glycosyltransferase
MYDSAILDIVIPVYGNPEGLRACLDSVEQTGLSVDYRVSIVDDYSPAEHKARLEAIYSTLPESVYKVYRNSENKGFPYTANKGAMAGRSPHILFLNSDIVLQSGALTSMLRVFAMSPEELPSNPGTFDEEHRLSTAGVVVPKLIFPEDTPHGKPGTVQHAGMCFHISGEPMHPFIGWSADNPLVNVRRSLQIATGACMMTSRAAWDAVVKNSRLTGDEGGKNGGFSEVYGRGTYEDIEYCLKVRGVGYKVIYEPEAVATHYVGASSALQEAHFNLKRNAYIFQARAEGFIRYDHLHFSYPVSLLERQNKPV